MSKEEELKVKLATLQPELVSQQLKDSIRQKEQVSSMHYLYLDLRQTGSLHNLSGPESPAMSHLWIKVFVLKLTCYGMLIIN